MTDYTNLKLSIDGHTATVTLTNPPAHTWTMDSLPALKQLVTDLNANDDVYALIIHGDGEKFFSAGADLNNFSDGDKGRAISMAIVCGERIDAETALRIGLVEEVAAKGEGLQAAQALAKKVAKQSPVAVSYSKTLIQAARNTPPAQNLIHEREAFVKLFDTNDQREGVQAFLEKRKPTWQNK